MDEKTVVEKPHQHAWELFVAQHSSVYYHFCRDCKSTLYDGRIYDEAGIKTKKET